MREWRARSPTILRGLLIDSSAWSAAFAVRARGRPSLVSAQTWGELGEIEALCAAHLERALTRELKSSAFATFDRAHTLALRVRDSLAGEPALVARIHRIVSTLPLDAWCAGMPQLDATLWPFFRGRTHYLGNTLALALNEPAPWPPTLWNRHRRSFS